MSATFSSLRPCTRWVEDDKLDYNPIEKYLKCEDLKRVGL